jgi:hypothetical protein
MARSNSRIQTLAREYQAGELMAAAAARHAAELLASGQAITDAAIKDAVDHYRALLHDALGAAK